MRKATIGTKRKLLQLNSDTIRRLTHQQMQTIIGGVVGTDPTDSHAIDNNCTGTK